MFKFILLLSTCCFAINPPTSWTAGMFRDSLKDSAVKSAPFLGTTASGKIIAVAKPDSVRVSHFSDSTTNAHKADTAIKANYSIRADSSRASHQTDTALDAGKFAGHTWPPDSANDAKLFAGHSWPISTDSARASKFSDTALKYDNRYLGLHGTADSTKCKVVAAKTADTVLHLPDTITSRLGIKAPVFTGHLVGLSDSTAKIPIFGTVNYLPKQAVSGYVNSVFSDVAGVPAITNYMSMPSSNLHLGYQAGNVDAGSNNAFISYQSGLANTSGYSNIGIGTYSLKSNAGGAYNIGIGYATNYLLNGGNYNTAIGVDANFHNVSGGYNTIIGPFSGYSFTGSNLTAIGPYAENANVSGDYGTAIGYYALTANTADGNSGIGYNALVANNTGTFNTAFGVNVMATNYSGAFNTAIGTDAGYYNYSGSHSIYLGAYAGFNSTHDNKLYVNSNYQASEAADSVNSIIYGVMNATGSSQYLYLGGGGLVTIPGSFKIAPFGTGLVHSSSVGLLTSSALTVAEVGAGLVNNDSGVVTSGYLAKGIATAGKIGPSNLSESGTVLTCGDSIASSKGATFSGYVGIGTANSITTLELVKTLAANEQTPLYLVNADAGSVGTAVSIGFQAHSSAQTGTISNVRTAAGQYALTFSNFDGATNSEHMRIIYNGNLGIGTTSPGHTLELYAGTGNTTLTAVNLTTATGSMAYRINGLDALSVPRGQPLTINGGPVTSTVNISGTTLNLYTTTTYIQGDIYTDLFQDWSSSANPVGWAATPTTVISYKKIGKTVFVYYYISGTSNNTGASFTLPYACGVPIPGSSSLYFPGLYSTAAVTMAAGTCNIANGSTTCTLGAVNNTSFPTTLAKSVQGEFFYETN